MKFRLLGGLEAESGGRPVGLGGPLRRLLVAELLLAAGRPVPKERLIRTLWEDEADALGAEALVPKLHSQLRHLKDDLRKAEAGAADLIAGHRDGYRLLVARDDVDLHRFRDLAGRVRELAARKDPGDDAEIAELGRRALLEWGQGQAGLLGCEPLAGLPGAQMETHRRELRKEHHRVLVACLAAELRLGRGARILPELERLHRAHPSDEPLLRHLMWAYMQAGARLQAIEAYERFRRSADDRFAADVSRETKQFYQRVLDDDPALGPRPDRPTEGAAMPPPANTALARRMADVLVPALPFLRSDSGWPQIPDQIPGDSWVQAKGLWDVLLRRNAVARLSEALRDVPDPGELSAQLAAVLAADGALAGEAAAILDGKGPHNAAGQFTIAGSYYHHGHNISGVNGTVVLGDQITHHHDDAGVRPIVPVRTPEDEPRGWRGGADVTVGADIYLLDERHLAERHSPDHCVVLREARALRRRQPRSQYVWLRQVEVREPTETARRALDALRRERELLDGLGRVRGLPRVHDYDGDGRIATLILAWPSSRAEPGRTLDAAFDVDGAADTAPPSAYQMFLLFGGLADLCRTLAVLHDRGLSHRALSPAGVIRLDGNGMALRDLGLAARPPAPREGPVEYPAPEQRSRLADSPGPHTDTYQLAALAHHLLTGRPPALRAPLPVGRQVPGLPAPLARALDAALDDEPSARPDIRSLGAAFDNARDDLSRGSDDLSPCAPPGPDHPGPR
ncbi:hypothetical protein Acsp04_18840 [Actinomadura sp. NBRC 104425]|nr:hypothetical protein Acsp04_18840 [Actinomadura sp. NBRC 104425]